MVPPKRFDVFFEKHIGVGIRWQTDFAFPFELSVSIPFVTFAIGFGKARS